MRPTSEQQEIIDHIAHHTGLVQVSSVAGSGKTSLLTMISRLPCINNGLYLAYTKTVATEAQRKFPDKIHCCTTHSLAFGPTVKSLGLTLGKLSYREVNLEIYEERLAVILMFKEFCLSRYTEIDEFLLEFDYAEPLKDEVKRLLADMYDGKIECTHEFYLKLYHIMLVNGDINYQPFSIIMLDEAGDLNEVTLEIFKLLPAVRKIMVGDSLQNIFGFNKTIDCFTVMANEGTQFSMTQSFRVSTHIANRIEKFCNKYIDPGMTFKGTEMEDNVIRSRAIIARTNATLIGKMIDFNMHGTPYNLTRDPAKMFEQVMTFIGMKYKGFIVDPSLRYLQADIDEFYEEKILQTEYKTLFAYLRKLYPKDPIIEQNIALISRYGSKNIINAFEQARKHKVHKDAIVLGTAHSTKGLEYDSVTIAPDLNKAIDDIISNIKSCKRVNKEYVLSDLERMELNLYYVACSRTRKEIINAQHLPV